MTSSASSKVERRQDAGQAARQHRLARAGRPDEQQVVAAGGGDLERAPRERLAAHVGEVGVACSAAARGRGSGGATRPRRRVAAARATASASVRDRHDVAGRRPPPPRRRWPPAAAAPATPRAAQADRDRQHAARRQHAPSSESSPTTAMSSTSRRGDDARARRGSPSGDRQVEAAPALRTSAGARFTVMRCGGNSKPELRIAARTRSRLSRTLASGRPTIAKTGRPNETSTSTRHREARRCRRSAALRTLGEHAADRLQGAMPAAARRGIVGGVRRRRGATAERARADGAGACRLPQIGRRYCALARARRVDVRRSPIADAPSRAGGSTLRRFSTLTP